jgi:hypothetical protein
MELLATVLLALATVATAWASYQSRQWTGEATLAAGRANAARVESARATGTANQLTGIDVATFIQWVDARELGRDKLADFYRARFRDEFQPAFAAWLATKPFENADAPKTPFAMPTYRLKATTEADRLEATAAARSNLAAAANQRANNYMLAVVLFASSLFFAGISSKLDSIGVRTAILAFGWILFLGTLVWLATLPIRVTI